MLIKTILEVEIIASQNQIKNKIILNNRIKIKFKNKDFHINNILIVMKIVIKNRKEEVKTYKILMNNFKEKKIYLEKNLKIKLLKN